MTEAEVAEAIRLDWHSAGWAFFTRLPCTIGFRDKGFAQNTPLDCMRIMDAFAMSLWPSRGFRRVGYEIKCSRADFQRELEDPYKSLRAYMLCHQFWFALSEGVWREGDGYVMRHHPIFTSYGVLSVGASGEITVHVRPFVHEPLGMSEAFIASLLRATLRIADGHE